MKSRCFPVIFACVLPAQAEAAAIWQAGFDLCVRPPSPSCVEAPSTYATPLATEACKQDLIRFINSVLAYRTCLAHEAERANLEANRLLQTFKCSQPSGDCPTPPKTEKLEGSIGVPRSEARP